MNSTVMFAALKRRGVGLQLVKPDNMVANSTLATHFPTLACASAVVMMTWRFLNSS